MHPSLAAALVATALVGVAAGVVNVEERVYIDEDLILARTMPQHMRHPPHITAQIEETLDADQMICNCTGGTQCGIHMPDGTIAKSLCVTRGGCKKVVHRPPGSYDASTGMHAIELSMHCVDEKSYFPKFHPMICAVAQSLRNTDAIHCCNNGNYCSSGYRMSLPAWTEPPAESSPSPVGILGAVALFVGCLLLVALGVMILIMLVGRRAPTSSKIHLAYQKCAGLLPGVKRRTLSALTPQPLNNEIADVERMINDACILGDVSTGSGSGEPLMAQRTFAHQVSLLGEGPVGQGKFGEVWRGQYKGELCAVKIFHSFEERSFLREVDIYQTNMLRHANILGFVASDNYDTGYSTQLWLVTDFHANGSLFDYLHTHSPTKHGMLLMVRSVANGLAFLHGSIDGTHTKPAIAHRDIKSKNILVKDDLSCCIADLGMAVRYHADASGSGLLDLPSGPRVGTRRYLSPEMLDGTLNEQQFDAYRRADVYSMGLVLWEIARCTMVDGDAALHELPYYADVPADPTQEHMKQVVCDDGCRPAPLDSWADDEVMQQVYGTMQECWVAKPASRLTALRVRLTVDNMLAAAGADGVEYAKRVAAGRRALAVERDECSTAHRPSIGNRVHS